VEERKPLHTVGKSINYTAVMENGMDVPQKIKNTTIIRSVRKNAAHKESS
jgi:hypothetical protein